MRRDNSLIDESVDTSFGGDIRQFLDERASTTTDEDEELREVGRACGKRVAGVIDNSDVLRSSEDRQGSLNGKRESGEVGDGVVGHATDGSVLKRNDGAIRAIWLDFSRP